MNQLSAITATYIGIAVTILLFSGIIYSFFNVRPLVNRIEEQEKLLKKNELKAIEDLNLLREELKSESQKNQAISEAEVAILTEKVNKDLSDLIHKQKMFELQSIWNEHYLWQIADVHINDLDALVRYLEKGIEYQLPRVEQLALNQIVRVLSVPDYFTKSHDQRIQDIQRRLIIVIGSIEGLELEKRNVMSAMSVLNTAAVPVITM